MLRVTLEDAVAHGYVARNGVALADLLSARRARSRQTQRSGRPTSCPPGSPVSRQIAFRSSVGRVAARCDYRHASRGDRRAAVAYGRPGRLCARRPSAADGRRQRGDLGDYAKTERGEAQDRARPGNGHATAGTARRAERRAARVRTGLARVVVGPLVVCWPAGRAMHPDRLLCAVPAHAGSRVAEDLRASAAPLACDGGAARRRVNRTCSRNGLAITWRSQCRCRAQRVPRRSSTRGPSRSEWISATG